MLLSKDNKDKLNSKYICDRCKREITNNERVTIYVEIHKINKREKKYDFCLRCYRAFTRGVEKRRY